MTKESIELHEKVKNHIRFAIYFLIVSMVSKFRKFIERNLLPKVKIYHVLTRKYLPT